MNIYLHTEIAARELDSKILLAVLAAARGHQVIVSDIETIEKGICRGKLAPGIFHTKSLTPGDSKITRHQNIIDNGSLVTSIDEESCLDTYGYDKFARIRYSEKSIDQSSAVFGWGPEDAEALKRIYPKYSSKIHMTGSPRADLWKPIFSDFWDAPKGKPNKPFLLIPSKMGFANEIKSFHEIVKIFKSGGYLKRDPDLLEYTFGNISENYRKMFAFIEAIKYLAKNNNGFDIVLRPHPVENIETWKILLKDIANVHVIQEGSINPWINNSFAVMHNSCTSAIEATVFKKPVITYIPFEQKYTSELPNELGQCVKSLEDLSSKVNTIFKSIKSGSENKNVEPLPEVITNKIYFDKNELAALKMIKIWESLASDNLLRSPFNQKRFHLFLKVMKFRGFVGKILRNFSIGKFGSNKKNHKFPPLDKSDVYKKFSKLIKIIGIKEKLECKLLSEKTILIRRH